MPLVGVCSVKSRPGTTTAALGLGVVLPASARPVVVECDPAGGDLTLRHGFKASPGLMELATATRGTAHEADLTDALGSNVISRFAQPLRLRDRTVEVVVAPPGGAQTRVALSVLARPDHWALTGTNRMVVADCGRLDASSAAWPLLGMADAVVVITRGRVDELAHLREHVCELVRHMTGRLVVVLASGGEYRAVDVEAMLYLHLTHMLDVPEGTVEVRELLPYDEQTAAVLDGSRAAGRGWRRRPLMVALERLAGDLPAVARGDIAMDAVVMEAP